MEDFRFFFRKNKRKKAAAAQTFIKRSEDGRVHTAMFSDFFSSIPDNMFCTNAMYAGLKGELTDTIDVFSSGERITVDLYERTPSDADIREVTLIGFRRYIRACYGKLRRQYITQIVQISMLALLGIVLVYVVYEIDPDLPKWINACIDLISCVLLWQFVGYWAFEHADRKREIDQLKQIGSIDFNFKQWE